MNQVRTDLIAVGMNDPYARIYDRRMIKLSAYTSQTAQAASNGRADATNQNSTK